MLPVVKAFAAVVLAALCAFAPLEGAMGQAPAPPVPAQTTATYGDWTLRCVNPAAGTGGTRSCEVFQTLSLRGQPQPLAQLAIGSVAKGSPQQITVVVPTAISFARTPQIKAGETVLLQFAWRRCLPSGCFADVAPTAEQIKALRARSENVQLGFQDAANQDVALAVSLKGLSAALDALAREDAAR